MPPPPIDDGSPADTVTSTAPTSIRALEVTPTPTDEEVAAVMAAMEALWPRPVVTSVDRPARRADWRFSGRWWARPLPVRRDRPWR